jgi:hypothetical protein
MTDSIERNGSCQVCQHLQRGQIEDLLANEVSLNDIASKFGIERTAVFRHWRHHVSADRKKKLAVVDGAAVRHPSLVVGPRGSQLHRKVKRLEIIDRKIIAMDEVDTRNVAGLAQLILAAERIEDWIEKKLDQEDAQHHRGRIFEGEVVNGDDSRFEAEVLSELQDDPERLARLERRLRGNTVDTPALPAPAQEAAA